MSLPAQPSPDIPLNFRRACILLSIAERPQHGYDILEGLVGFGLKDSDPGGVYRLLAALEQEGLARSSWARSQVGPPRRVYRTTAKGRRWLDEYAEQIPQAMSVLRRYSSRHRGLKDPEKSKK